MLNQLPTGSIPVVHLLKLWVLLSPLCGRDPEIGREEGREREIGREGGIGREGERDWERQRQREGRREKEDPLKQRMMLIEEKKLKYY